MDEKYLRDYAVLDALHPGTVPYREDEVENGAELLNRPMAD